MLPMSSHFNSALALAGGVYSTSVELLVFSFVIFLNVSVYFYMQSLAEVYGKKAKRSQVIYFLLPECKAATHFSGTNCNFTEMVNLYEKSNDQG